MWFQKQTWGHRYVSTSQTWFRDCMCMPELNRQLCSHPVVRLSHSTFIIYHYVCILIQIWVFTLFGFLLNWRRRVRQVLLLFSLQSICRWLLLWLGHFMTRGHRGTCHDDRCQTDVLFFIVWVMIRLKTWGGDHMHIKTGWIQRTRRKLFVTLSIYSSEPH